MTKASGDWKLDLLKEMQREGFHTCKKLVAERAKENPVMNTSIISAIALTAIICACPILQSCSDSSSQTTDTTTSDPGDGYSPSETTTTTTTTTNQPDTVVGATADAAGTIVEAPFRIVGDALGVIF